MLILFFLSLKEYIESSYICKKKTFVPHIETIIINSVVLLFECIGLAFVSENSM